MTRAFLAALAVLVATSGCGDVVRAGRSPMLLVVDSLQGAPGGGFGAGKFGNVLDSDVIVNLTSPAPCTQAAPCPTYYGDSGQVTLHAVPKDVSITPTSNNAVTITRFHVDYVRADGHNTPGVDVPFGFDGSITGTVPPTGTVTMGFVLVRSTAKIEAPLIQLVSNPQTIDTLAQVTFYGTDQVGNAISASASMTVDFGNFGDQ